MSYLVGYWAKLDKSWTFEYQFSLHFVSNFLFGLVVSFQYIESQNELKTGLKKSQICPYGTNLWLFKISFLQSGPVSDKDDLRPRQRSEMSYQFPLIHSSDHSWWRFSFCRWSNNHHRVLCLSCYCHERGISFYFLELWFKTITRTSKLERMILSIPFLCIRF